ncbi:MAG: hypothetical protein JXA15_04520 [Spirochaetales bacterium]|nr:hypothetical protein [Spirochaetales bacterium]
MNRTLAVLLRAPLAMAVLLIAASLLGAVAALPAAGLGSALMPATLVSGMADAFPWAVSLTAWYLSMLTVRRFKSRLASHSLVFVISAAFMLSGSFVLGPVDKVAPTLASTDPKSRRFIASGNGLISAEAWRDGMADGLLVVEPESSPRMTWHARAAWRPDENLVTVDGRDILLASSDSAPGPDGYAPPLIRAGGSPSAWFNRQGGTFPLLLMALSYAALAAGVRFPVRMFAWTMPGAMIGLLFAMSVPGLYGILGSPYIGEALALVGVSLEPATYAVILAASCGLLLFGADLVFRPADEPVERFDA